MKKLLLALFLGLLTFTAVHAQQTVVIERHGIFTDLASAAGAIVVVLPLAAVEGIITGTVEAASSLIHGSTEIVVVPPAKVIPAPVIVAPPPMVAAPGSTASIVIPRVPAVIPTTTIITTHGDGTVTTATRQASCFRLAYDGITPFISTNNRKLLEFERKRDIFRI